MLPALDILGQEIHGFALPRTRGLVHYDLKTGILLPDLLRREEMRPGGENGRLEHRMTSSIEANELPAAAAMHHLCIDSGTGRCGVDCSHLQLPPGARGFQHGTSHDRRREGRKLGTGDGSLGEQHRVIRQVYHCDPSLAQVAKGGGLQKGLQQYGLFTPLNSHGGEVDHPLCVNGGYDGLENHRTRSAGGGAEERVLVSSEGIPSAPSAARGTERGVAGTPWRKWSSKRYPCSLNTDS